ncbi:MAG: trehalase-like domain-containing protein, partial [Luteococcus japonicus]
MTTGHTPIEEYGFLSDRRGSALVSAEGSVDWLCLPDFDSAACMASVLGDEQHGRWLLRPADPRARATRRYLTDSLVLETTWECDGATATVVEFMPTGNRRSDLIRRVEGIRGEMSWRHEWCVRPWYGSRRPLVQLVEQRGRQALVAVDGPDRYELKGPHLAEPDAQGRLVGEFTVEAGECVEFDMVWHPSTMREPEPRTAADTLEATLAVDREWLVDCGYEG